MQCKSFNRLGKYLLICLLVHSNNTVGQQPQAENPDDEMLTLLQNMVRDDPTRSDSWRIIGRIYKKRNQLSLARQAFEQALEVQPDNIAAHADIGDLLSDLGENEAARVHYADVMSLGPDSSYAADLVERGICEAPSMKSNSASSGTKIGDDELDSINLIGYEIQTFDGADDLERILDVIESDTQTPTDQLRTVFEIGTLYNTNLSLTPISRSLRTGDGASAQLFINPSIEWIAFNNASWRAGPLGRGYFTFNEGSFESLNLASFQPGLFLERDLELGDRPVVGRLDYVYGIDLLGGSHFGDRHSVTASLTAILPDSDAVYGYFTTSNSNFKQDGTVPAVESLDGFAYTAGISRFFTTDSKWVPTWTLGTDLEHAATRGADFRYTAANLHTDATLQFNDAVSLTPRAGVGYRHYPDFTGIVDRDELTWRIGARLKWQCTKNFSVSAVVGYDRFASDNEQFDTNRTEAGIVFAFTH